MKVLIPATETAHLPYSVAELASILFTVGLPKRGHRARLVSFDVRFLDAASFRLLAFEVFLRAEYFFQSHCVSPVILDCGANIGLATLFFKRLYPKAVVHAFEADPTTAEVLRWNVERNRLQDVTVHNILLSDQAGPQKFYVADGTPGSLMMSALSTRLASNAREITTNSARLSEYINGPIDLLKLDVEGSEFVVINDLLASGKIAQIAQMMIEYHHLIGNESSRLASFLAQLEDAGFNYQIEASFNRSAANGQFQDILINAYRA